MNQGPPNPSDPIDYGPPNRALIAALEAQRGTEQSAVGTSARNTISISLDLYDSTFAIDEAWSEGLDEDQRIWLTAYTAVCGVLRYAAYVRASEFNTIVRRIAQGRVSNISDWGRRTEVGYADVRFELEMLGAPGELPFGGHLSMEVPEGLTELQVLEPIEILRTYLLNHHEPTIDLACGLALETLASLAARDRLHPDSLDEALEIQKNTPALVMRLLEGVGRVAPLLGTEFGGA